MKIVIPGGSGQVGTLVARHYHARGHEVVVLSRHAAARPWRVVAWDGATAGAWTNELDGCDVVMNLAGYNVNCRYTATSRQLILDSRVASTRAVGAAVAAARRPPAVWLQASTATIYAHRFDAANDEATGILGGDEPDVPASWRFSVEVAHAWEQALLGAATPHTRKVALRSAMTMSADAGGVFDTLLGLVRFGLGGAAGDGRQFISWIHADDFLRAVEWLIADRDLDGAVNLAAPQPVTNAAFMRALRQAWGTTLALPAPRWALPIGAFLMRTETELILKSRRVVPGRLLQRGFEFRYPCWADAAADLCRQVRAGGAPRGSHASAAT